MLADEQDLTEADPIAVLALPQIEAVLAEVKAERIRQDVHWGFFRDFPDGGRMPSDGPGLLGVCRLQRGEKATWRGIFGEEVYEALVEVVKRDERNLEVELIQVAAVACAWVEALRRRRDEKRKPVYRLSWWKRLLAWGGR